MPRQMKKGEVASTATAPEMATKGARTLASFSRKRLRRADLPIPVEPSRKTGRSVEDSLLDEAGSNADADAWLVIRGELGSAGAGEG
jgi:hypothetical protein